MMSLAAIVVFAWTADLPLDPGSEQPTVTLANQSERRMVVSSNAELSVPASSSGG